jgi:hypothetical protein
MNKPITEAEWQRRQMILDAWIEAKMIEWQWKRERDEARSWTKAPGDPDWDLK